MGCTTASIPLIAGGRERHAASGSMPELQTDPALVEDT
jgi:hypothetical protein